LQSSEACLTCFLGVMNCTTIPFWN
jgi:hypothetical protein